MTHHQKMIPLELWDYISQYLGLKDFAACCCTNRYCRWMLQQTSFSSVVYHGALKYILESASQYNPGCALYGAIRRCASKGNAVLLAYLIPHGPWDKDGRAIAFASDAGSLKCVQLLYHAGVPFCDDKVVDYIIADQQYWLPKRCSIQQIWDILLWLSQQKDVLSRCADTSTKILMQKFATLFPDIHAFINVFKTHHFDYTARSENDLFQPRTSMIYREVCPLTQTKCVFPTRCFSCWTWFEQSALEKCGSQCPMCGDNVNGFSTKSGKSSKGP